MLETKQKKREILNKRTHKVSYTVDAHYSNGISLVFKIT